MKNWVGPSLLLGVLLVVGVGSTIAVLIFAQAPRPENIEAIPVSQMPYINLTCEQLNTELVILDERLEALAARQNRNRVRDTLLNLFLKLGSGAVAGNEEAAIAQTKGERIAVLRESPRCLAEQQAIP